MKFIKSILKGFSLLLIICILGAVFSYYVLKNSEPDYQGEISVDGIENDIAIMTDSMGVPYISASSSGDAAFALGYAHARERMWQMDLVRRAASGRLSEIFGNKTVVIDKLFRTIGLERSINKYYENLNLISKSLLENYSNGVNAYLDKKRNNCGIEFDLLNYTPENWTPIHSLLISRMMSALLNINWWTDMAYTDLFEKLDPNMVNDIISGYPENAPLIVPPNANNLNESDKSFIAIDKLFRKLFNFEGTHIGSNNWVINNKMSKSGKPLIANDIHLALQLPGTWFAVSINSPEWNAAGFSLPGLPGIVIGINGSVSWAVTNVMTDDSDFYYEKIDSSRTKYFFDGKWNNLETFNDTINVRDSASVIFKIEKTHRGPIINKIHPFNFLYDRNSDNDISMKWAALEESDELFGIYSVNNSKNWEEFKKALSYYKTPGQNFMYSDSSGNIGYITAANIPIRYNNSPSVVYNGTIDKYDWKGFVNYNKMPKVYNPKQNYLASANNKIKKNFKYHISNIWEPPSRILRIKELLESKQKHSLQDFKKYQMDNFSHYAKEIVPYIVKSFEGIKIYDENLSLAVRLLSQWDFKMSKESQSPTVFLVFYQKLLENIFLDEMGEESFNEFLFIANVPYKTVTKLLGEKYSKWYDDQNTEKIEDRDDIFRKSLSDAVYYLGEKVSKNPAHWQWGKLHKFELKHPFAQAIPFLGKLMNIGPFEIDGDGTTINNTEYSFNEPFNVKVGASCRFLYDFNTPNKLLISLPAGQSGHFSSSHYSDFTKLWLKGEYHSVYLYPENENVSEAKLMLRRITNN